VLTHWEQPEVIGIDRGERASDAGRCGGATVAQLKKGIRVTGAEREKLAQTLVKRYEAGASIRELAKSTGRSYGFIHRVLDESGVTLRGRGGATRSKKSS
jgi:hypothetical protein